MARRGYAASDISVDRYEDRREYDRRPNGRSRVIDDRYYENEEIYRSRDPPRRRDEVMEREEVVKIRSRSRERSPPPFLREDYGRTTAGPVVLRAREREEFDFAPRPPRRSPSPEPERVREKEEIIIRKDDRDRLPPPAPPPPPVRGREEIIIRKDERESSRRPPLREISRERDEVIIRRDDRYDRRPPREYERDREREEIIIRRDEDEREARYDRRREYDDYYLDRPKSHERERSRVGRGANESDEIIIRRDEREGRGGDREREEIIIRRNSRSPSPVASPRPPPKPPAIHAPPIVQEVITHHHHIDHGYDMAVQPVRPRPPSRAPSPPREDERIEIRRRGERNGRSYDEDIIIDRNEGPGRAVTPRPPPPPPPEPVYDPAPVRRPYYRDDRDIQEEAAYYNDRAMARAYPGEAYRGATRDWSIVDVPPGTQRVRMDGAGGGEQEITWQRYNGVRRSKFYPDGPGEEGYGSELARPLPAPAPGGQIGARYGNPPDPRDRLWTEITKDLVVKEAIQEMGYEFEETEDFYYIFKYLTYVSPPVLANNANHLSTLDITREALTT